MPVSTDPESYKGITAIAAGVGMAIGWGVYYYYKLRGKPALDPETKNMLDRMQKDIEAVGKSVSTLSSQLDYMAQDHHHVERRVAKIEQNGRPR